MAERRMFAKTIIDSDQFLDMPLSTQALYFHLSMRADDEGFINNPKKIMRMIGSTQDEMDILLAKNFVLSFDTGVIVIKHWRMHNYIQKDRFHPTAYQEERQSLKLKENNSYTFVSKMYTGMDTECVQDASPGKVRLGKESIVKNREEGETASPEPEGSKEIAPIEKNNGKELSSLKDTIAQYWQESLIAIQPHTTWANYGKERKSCGDLSKRTKGLLVDVPYDYPEELIEDIISVYLRLRKTATNDYWKRAPVTPSSVLTRWSELTTELAQRWESVQGQYNGEVPL